MLVLSKKKRFALLGAGFLLMAVIAFFSFADTEMWYRARMKQNARSKSEQLLSEAMEQRMLPPLRHVFEKSEYCRAPNTCTFSNEWDKFNPDGHDIRFSGLLTKELVIQAKNRMDVMQLRLSVFHYTVNAREFLEHPVLSRQDVHWNAYIRFISTRPGLKFKELEPGLQQLGLGLAGVFVGDETFDLSGKVIEPCGSKGRFMITFGDHHRVRMDCEIRNAPHQFTNFPPIERLGMPKSVWALLLDVGATLPDWPNPYKASYELPPPRK